MVVNSGLERFSGMQVCKRVGEEGVGSEVANGVS